MNRNIKILIGAVVLLVALSVGGYAYWLVGRPVKAPSTTQTPADVTSPTPTADALTTTEGETVFHIVPDESVATFTLGEELRGQPVTVIGTTKNIGGDITLDRSNLTKARISTIKINARTFLTDSEQRDRAIVRMIFKSEDDANEFIEFMPTGIDGIPVFVDDGTSFSFTINGDLTISGVTKPMTFLGSATFASDKRLEGTASTTVKYKDFGISIPELPFLANVDEDVNLRFDFVAEQ